MYEKSFFFHIIYTKSDFRHIQTLTYKQSGRKKRGSMNNWYQSSKEMVLQQLQTSERGLTTRAAKTILAQVGENT